MTLTEPYFYLLVIPSLWVLLPTWRAGLCQFCGCGNLEFSVFLHLWLRSLRSPRAFIVYGEHPCQGVELRRLLSCFR